MSCENMLTVWAEGAPVAQGSMKSFVHAKTGRAVMLHGNRERLAAYRAALAVAVKAELARSRVDWDKRGAFTVDVQFVFQRPKTHYKKNMSDLRIEAPVNHDQRPDIDKLQRAVLDALTGVLWRDDCQVSHVLAGKVWSDSPYGQRPARTVIIVTRRDSV